MYKRQLHGNALVIEVAKAVNITRCIHRNDLPAVHIDVYKRQVRAEYDEAFKMCDVIVTPTAPTAAFKIGENVHDPLKTVSYTHLDVYKRQHGPFAAWEEFCKIQGIGESRVETLRPVAYLGN